MRFQSYSSYKPSGVEWIGEIPEHWNITKVKWVTSQIRSGKTPRGGSEVYSDSGVAFLRSQNVHPDGLRLDDVVYISDEIDREMSSTRVLPKDILINITGASLGRSCIVPEQLPKANVNQHVCIVRPIETLIIPEFLQCAIGSDAVLAQIFASEVGASREGLNFSEVGNLVFATPQNLDEQQSIAHLLARETTTIDTLIAKKKQLIQVLQKQRMALISHAVTKGLDLHVRMRESGVEWLGEIPEHWNLFRLKFGHGSRYSGELD